MFCSFSCISKYQAVKIPKKLIRLSNLQNINIYICTNAHICGKKEIKAPRGRGRSICIFRCMHIMHTYKYVVFSGPLPRCVICFDQCSPAYFAILLSIILDRITVIFIHPKESIMFCPNTPTDAAPCDSNPHEFCLSWSCLYSKGIISVITEMLQYWGETQHLCG